MMSMMMRTTKTTTASVMTVTTVMMAPFGAVVDYDYVGNEDNFADLWDACDTSHHFNATTLGVPCLRR